MTDGVAHSFEFDDLDGALVRGLSPDALLEQVELRRAEGTHRQCDAALHLLEAYGRLRSPAEIAALLALLPNSIAGRVDRVIVVQGAAIGRPADESAQIAAFLADRDEQSASTLRMSGVPDTDQMCRMVAAFRPARDIAQFAVSLATASHSTLGDAVVSRAAERRSMQTVARLELTLRAHNQPDLASRAVMVALGRRSLAAEITELIDYQLAYGPRLTEDATVSEPVATHIREHMPEETLVDLVLRQYARDPGRALAWSAGVAESARRPICTVVQLLAKASADHHADLVEKITTTVATHRNAEDLIAFVSGCAANGLDVFETLLSQVSAQASVDTISNLVQLYNAQDPARNARLSYVLAENAPATTLIGAGAHLAARRWHNLADDLLRAALKNPERYTAADVAGLLAGVSKKAATIRRPRRNDVVHDVIRRLETLFSDPRTPINVAYLAELSCAAAELMDEPRAADVRTQIGNNILAGYDDLSAAYIAALRARGYHGLAEEYREATWGVLTPSRATTKAPYEGRPN